MTLAAPAPTMSLRRVQGGLVVCSLLGAVIGTVALMAPPARSSSAATTSAATTVAGPGPAPALPAGLRVAVEGGDAFGAYGLADRLTAAGAAVGAVSPAASRDDVAATTTIVYYDVGSLAAASRIRAMLGGGTLRRQRVFEPPVDVTIVLGKDLPRL